MKRVCRTAIAWAIHVADDLRYFLKCSTDVCAKGSESPTKFQNLTVVSCSLFFSCDRKFRVMEKQTSEDTEEADHFKSCHFEQVWAGLSRFEQCAWVARKLRKLRKLRLQTKDQSCQNQNEKRRNSKARRSAAQVCDPQNVSLYRTPYDFTGMAHSHVFCCQETTQMRDAASQAACVRPMIEEIMKKLSKTGWHHCVRWNICWTRSCHSPLTDTVIPCIPCIPCRTDELIIIDS